MSASEYRRSDPQPSARAPIAHLIEPVEKDLGGFSVRRVLPDAACPRVGPFIFFDQMGPARFPVGQGIDVRPHPHIGLSTLTYLFEGSILHRDSLGVVQPIEPGAVNWMTAGRGIVHSERTPQALRESGSGLHGIQAWIALPDGQEEIEPSFDHHPASTLPTFGHDDARLTLIAGEAFGERSPVRTYSPLFYLHAQAGAGAALPLPDGYAERAFYVVEGAVRVSGERIEAGRMAVLSVQPQVMIEVLEASRLMLLGGEPLASDRTVWWNFSSSSKTLIEQAKEDWRRGRFAAVPGETEFIPLPGD